MHSSTAVERVRQTRVARFFLVQNTKTGEYIPYYYELYQMSIKYNNRPQSGPSVRKIHQHLPLQDPQKFSQIWIFGLKKPSGNPAPD
jgi:hypothetical protein